MNEEMEEAWMKFRFVSPLFIGAILLLVPIILAVLYL